jgi:large subunit ribosomal protein L30
VSERSELRNSVGQITVTQVKSGIGAKPKTKGTLRALGLGRIGKSNTLPDRPDVRGMIARVPHLVRVEDASTDEPARSDASFSSEDPERAEAAPAASRPEDLKD